ncbi:MAG TPA: hypothetical protein VMD29_13010 [Terracidiphilus sp.]|nr:hypothetical protein [Terracidiphilus sp.]
MPDAEKDSKKRPPKGGRKGGTLFPKVKLQQAVDYAKKLVSKTHTGPLPEQTILPGVFGSAGSTGKVRASALKQYGLLEGQVEEYKATQLAKDIDAAPDDDARTPLLQRALLSSKTFLEMFQTFQGDTVSKAKVVQRAKGLKVHPDSADECADIFVDSVVTAKLASNASGDSITLIHASGASSPPQEDAANESEAADAQEEQASGGDETDLEENHQLGVPAEQNGAPGGQAKARAIVNLNLTVDSSSDPDKLEKQLKLLKQFGML